MKRRVAGMLSNTMVKRRVRDASMRDCIDDKWGRETRARGMGRGGATSR
jgi:hypothetical protein